jgi:4-amino-4-deoxy-L-arabinose transferase-like glycosyltransferase
MKHFFKFIYALFFTRDDDLDILQLLFTVLVVMSLFILWKLTLIKAEVSDVVIVESIKTLRWMIGLLVLTAIPKWLVPFMSGQIKSNPAIEQKSIETTEETATEEPS